MISPAHQPGSGERVEVIKGMYHIPDFENPLYHDGHLAHYSHFMATGEELGVAKNFASRAFLQTYLTAVAVVDKERLVTRFNTEPVAARKLDWRFNPRSQHATELQKRLRIFMTNDLVADTFYDHILPTSSDWPSRYLDVIEALLKSRSYDRDSEKRAAQLARRAELS
jgi:hypothetical protein